MAYRVIRLKKEARRNTKLDEIFQQKDGADGSIDGTITRQELEEIYRVYEVDLNPAAVDKILDENGEINRETFLRFAVETKLLEFKSVMGGGGKESTVRKPGAKDNKAAGLLCCAAKEEDVVSLTFQEKEEKRLERIEAAFRKFDLDGDGYLSWDEFQQIGLGEEMARRIFREVQVEPGKLSLDQFQHLANWRGPLDS